MNKQLIILDRDGVVNYDSDDYIKNPEEWLPIDSSILAIAELCKAGFLVAIASNQSGISRGYFSEQTLDRIHQKMLSIIRQQGGDISAIEYCPDHPDHPGHDRKPSPGMALKLLKQFNADPSKTWFVGDSLKDIQCAENAHCKPALVLTGKGQTDQYSKDLNPDVPVFKNLAYFVAQLLSK